MNSEIGVTQLIATLVPLIISGLVAVYTASTSTKNNTQIAALQLRVAVLEQLLSDNKIPIPPAPPATKSDY